MAGEKPGDEMVWHRLILARTGQKFERRGSLCATARVLQPAAGVSC
jgi:hypothetical protein